MKWTALVALALSLVMSAASLGLSTLRTRIDRGEASALAGASRPAEVVAEAAIEPNPELDRVPGLVEPLPRNVFHVVPYNDWPLFEILVEEGQRLKFERRNGRWEGDRGGLTVQLETPAEVESMREDVEIARLERESAQIAEGLLGDELQRTLDAALARETSARQEVERLQTLRNRTATSDQEAQRARSQFDLARGLREQAGVEQQKKLAQARLQTEAAEHRLRRARSRFELADFQREMSWGNVPHRGHEFVEVVVTRVSAAIGDVPGKTGPRQPWVEVIDDRVLQVRCLVPLETLERIARGKPVQVNQERRNYPGTVAAINIVADRRTHRVPVLVKVDNHDRKLKINTLVTVDFLH